MLNPEGFGVSLKGAYSIFPSVTKRELNMLSRCLIGNSDAIDKDIVGVVEANSEIVDGIADDSRRVDREFEPELADVFPRIVISLSSNSFDVSANITSKNCFKLSDVIIGPFYF